MTKGKLDRVNGKPEHFVVKSAVLMLEEFLRSKHVHSILSSKDYPSPTETPVLMLEEPSRSKHLQSQREYNDYPEPKTHECMSLKQKQHTSTSIPAAPPLPILCPLGAREDGRPGQQVAKAEELQSQITPLYNITLTQPIYMFPPSPKIMLKGEYSILNYVTLKRNSKEGIRGET